MAYFHIKYFSNCLRRMTSFEMLLPNDIRTAHRDNDRAVMDAYGMDVRTTTEASCVTELMRRYREMTEK